MCAFSFENGNCEILDACAKGRHNLHENVCISALDIRILDACVKRLQNLFEDARISVLDVEFLAVCLTSLQRSGFCLRF